MSNKTKIIIGVISFVLGVTAIVTSFFYSVYRADKDFESYMKNL